MKKSMVLTGHEVTGVMEYLKVYREIFIVSDRNVSIYSEVLSSACKGCYILDATEANKTMATVVDICKWLMDMGADRQALVLAVGGGITTDIAGFAAAVYMRGVRFAFIPTTLLAQVDAAIGGKTGVNLQNYKNILGVIRQPEFTFICTEFLVSLPYRDFLSGAAELLKTFIINNKNDNYSKAVALLSGIRSSEGRKDYINGHRIDIESLVVEAARIKSEIVSHDEMEHGERRKLNLGHTFAHAIEWESRVSKHDITHGEAVSIGIVLAARLSEKVYESNTSCQEQGESLSERLILDFKSCGLPVECPFTLQSLAEAMSKDKKSEFGMVHFVLIRAIGDVVIDDLSVKDALSMISD